jgi:HEAT repeat protein
LLPSPISLENVTMSRQHWTNDKLFTRLLNNKSGKTYWDNISELRKRGTEDIFARCYQLATTGNDGEREMAITVLAQLGHAPRPYYAQTIALCFELLDTALHPHVLRAVLYAIGHNNRQLNAKQTRKVVSFKHHTHKGVRFAMVFALLGVNNTTAIDTLIAMTTDKVADIRNWATFGIGSQLTTTSEKITAALWNRISDTDTNTRLEAIAGLARRKDPRVAGMPELAQLTDCIND